MIIGMIGVLIPFAAALAILLAILMAVTKIQYGSWWNPYNSRGGYKND